MVKDSSPNKKTKPNTSLLLTTFRKIKPTSKSLRSLRLFSNKQRPHHKTILIKQDNIQHIGRNYQKDGSEKLVKYIVGIKDTETQKVEFVELKDIYDISLRVPEVEEKHEISQPFYDPEHKRRLVQEFGTNKSKRKVNQMMSNTIK